MLPSLRHVRHLATLRSRATVKLTPQQLYEPVFSTETEFPQFPTPILVRLQGYDSVPLEKYQSFVHRIAKRFSFTVDDRYIIYDIYNIRLAPCSATQSPRTLNASFSTSRGRRLSNRRWTCPSTTASCSSPRSMRFDCRCSSPLSR
jgi:hypothetical protein